MSEEKVNNDDTLGSDNESDNESIMSDNPAADNYEACKAAAREYTGKDASNLGAIEQAILSLKTTLYMETFQNGSADKVHNTERLSDYVNMCGNIYRHITQGEPLGAYSPTINNAIQSFLTIWNANAVSTPLEKEMQLQYLHLHLICFCYCHNSDCLSMDDTEEEASE
jgi:hypothetical protein